MMKNFRNFTYSHLNWFAPVRMLARGVQYARGRWKYRGDLDRLERFRGLHRGERCFIVATGPSLTVEDLERLRGETCFGVNACVRLFDKTGWRPKYYGITDRRVYEDLKGELRPEELETVFFADAIPLAPAKNAYRFLLNELPIDYEGTVWQRLFRLPAARFTGDAARRRVYAGGTVAYAMLQLAAFMGFSEICLLGVDCNYTGPAQHAQGTEKGRPRIGRDTALRTGERMLEAFEVARQYADRHGIAVWNATRGGRLEAFGRRTLEEILKG